MAPSTFRSSAVVLPILVVALAGASGSREPAGAQSPAPSPATSTLRRVIDVQLKPESVRAWGNLHRDEMLPAARKGNIPWLDVWTSAAGDPYMRTLVSPIDTMTELEFSTVIERGIGHDKAQDLLERNRTLLTGVRTYIMRTRPDLGFASAPARRSVGLLSTITVHAGRTGEFESLLKQSVVETLKGLNVSSFVVLQVMYGGDPNQYRTLLTFDNQQEINAATGHPDPIAWLQQHVPKNIDGLGPQPDSPVARVERTIIRYLPDLSYRPPTD